MKDNSNKILRLKLKMSKQIGKKKFAKAILTGLGILELDSQDYQVHQKIAELYQKQGNKQLAVKHYTQTAILYEINGFYQKAIAAYNMVLKIEPNDPEISNKIDELTEKIEQEKNKPKIGKSPSDNPLRKFCRT